MRFVCCTLGLLLLTACGEPHTTTPTAANAKVPPAIEHDFGVIPHGQSRQHDFVLDPAQLTGPAQWIPLHVQLDCSCGRAQLLLRAADGTERLLDGRPSSDNAPAAGESVLARVVIDTAAREAVDLPKTVSHGYVVLQSVDDPSGSRRIRWPLRMHFGVDAPVLLTPFAALDFGRVPRCRVGEAVTSLRGDDNHAGIQFGRVTANDAQLAPVLEPEGDHVLLRVLCHPAALGNHRAVVSVETDLPGYVVHLDVTWKVVADLEAMPMAKVSFRGNLRREQTEDEASGQFVLVTDHDVSRPPEFVVRALVDDAGEDATASFQVTFEAVPGEPRRQRLHVRYLGRRPDGFRGHIVLGKPGLETPTLPIELVAFPTHDS